MPKLFYVLHAVVSWVVFPAICRASSTYIGEKYGGHGSSNAISQNQVVFRVALLSGLAGNYVGRERGDERN